MKDFSEWTTMTLSEQIELLRLESQRTRIAYAKMPFNPKRIYGAA